MGEHPDRAVARPEEIANAVALTIQAIAGGRLTLGVAVSRRPAIVGMHTRPAARQRYGDKVA